jgi:NADH-quinone oxidoreductase subunit N
MSLTQTDLLSILPALALMAGAFVAVGGCAFVKPEKRQRFAERTSGFSIAFSLTTVLLRISAPAIEGFHGAVRLDNMALFLSLAILAATGLTVVLSTDIRKEREIPHGEYAGLLLLAASGMMVLVESADLITFFIALEILSLALYALAGMYRRDPRSNEAAIKYFVMGAFASGFLLYGMAFLYGATGSVSIAEIGRRVSSATATPASFVTLGFAMVTIGLAFKVGAVPFHQWVPDVYEGAPTAVTAFMSVSVKAAGFGGLLRILLQAAGPDGAAWGSVVWGIALATMVAGNLLAIGQRSVKRMLAYSSVAHAGTILVAVAALGSGTLARESAASAALFYLFVYTFMTLGAFAFLIYAEESEDLAGLAKRRPWAALAMTVFLMSLAGIPPTAGFFGKFLIFRAALEAG